MVGLLLLIKIDSATKVYSKKQGAAADSLTLEVRDGEVVGFVGLNGAGKTTLIRMIAGVSLPTSGQISVDGHDIVRDKVEASRRIGWVPEFPNFEPNAKAISLMIYFAGFYGIKGVEAERKGMQLLSTTGLAGFEKRKVRTYSQGMKKRFSMAASMLADPGNFLFDEILNGLDPEGIRYFRQLIFDFRKRGKAVLLSSHILLEVESIADRVVIIHKGKIIRVITNSEIANLGGSSIRISVRNLDDRALSYLRSLGEIRVEGSTIFLTKTNVDPPMVNSELVRMGYLVTEFGHQKQGLEEYFLGLVEGARK